MKKLKIGVVMVVQNDAETIERTFRSFYNYVDFITVSTDSRQGWTGEGIIPDETIDIIEKLDIDNKTDILQGNFFVYDEPLKNETFQRQVTADLLINKVKDLDWICQIDADEEFLDFELIIKYLKNVPLWCRGLKWSMAQVFNVLDDGRLLVVVNDNEQPNLYNFHLAHRPKAKLVMCRMPAIQPFSLNRQTLRLNEVLLRSDKFNNFIQSFDGYENPSGLCLHYTFAKSEKRIEEKLRTWGHAKEFDTEAFFELWKRSKTDWQNIRNFHPQVPENWKALKPFTLNELKNISPFRNND